LGQVSCGSLLIWVRILWDMGYLGKGLVVGFLCQS
jgi:hypothetical protein